MITEYNSKDQDFLSRSSNTYLTLMFIGPLGVLALTALGYAIAYGGRSNGFGRTRKYSRIWQGLSYMDATTIVVTIVIGVLIFLALTTYLKSRYERREIVVGLKFDDEKKELTVKTKTITSEQFTRTHKYNDLALEGNNLSDGMTPPMYDTLTLVKGNYLAGHIFLDHFTWDEKALSEMRAKLYRCVRK